MAQPCEICKSVSSNHLPEGLISFGPVYDPNASSIVKNAKENTASTSKGNSLIEAKHKAWDHVREKTLGGEKNTEKAYRRAIQNIEGEARHAYAARYQAIDDLKFQDMMIMDGCLFLQIVMLILGGSSQLGYLAEDPIFGIDIQEEDKDRWIQSMLLVGNQIPFVVLKELMKQPFFRQVLGKMKLKRPSGLLEIALYEVLLTGLKNHGNPGMWCDHFQWLFDLTQWISEKLRFGKKVCSKRQEPCDLIHSLHQLVLGESDQSSHKGKIHGLHLSVLGGIQKTAEEGNNDKSDQSSRKGKRNTAEESKPKIPTANIPSAKKLSEMGIKIKKENGSKSARTHFESNWFSATLYLPKFIAGKTGLLILKSLIDYEKAQQDKQEVTSDVKFMSELVCEPTDAKFLHDKGIIDADLQQRKKFPEIKCEAPNQ